MVITQKQEEELGELLRTLLFDSDSVDRAKHLIEQGVDIHERDPTGDTALHYALLHEGSGEIAKLLIENGADLEATNDNGDTPLMWAARHNKISSLVLLIDKGVPLDTRGNYNYTALDWADAVGSHEAAKVLRDAIEHRQLQAAEKAAHEADEKRIATLHDTASKRQVALARRRTKLRLLP